MDKPRTLIGLLDLPGSSRDALAETLGKGRFAVAAAERLEDLPDGVELIVAHVRAVPSREWPALSRRVPTVVVTESRLDEELLHAVDSGLVDYLVEPLRHGDVLRRLVARALEHQQLAEEHARDRTRLAELNENLETHLAMLRLDQQAGGHIQRKLLPPESLTLNGVRCDFRLVPSLYLSGDFLDFQRFDARYSVFYFADVSGHGASSAFVTVLLKYLCNRWLNDWDGDSPETLPARWLARLNRELLDTGIGKHATLFVGVLDAATHRLHYSLGAQMPMPLCDDGQSLEALAGEGMPVGLFPGIDYPNYCLELPASFRLWLCSDGVLECLPGETLTARLDELKRRITASGDIRTLLAGLGVERDDDTPHDQEELPDDLTIMTLSGFNHGNQ
ncbi:MULTISPECIES: SpoIIE family protein phosphatase [unclassified Modicisalibacter]|uniref:PP2C family protein-serine/threonine phosphatase n=1 Tax=unclassified Modicisalibacter TaxID=2679913 RepID=UPI001CCE29C2|nr:MULTISPECIES: SpoIIE family protein phosphatase [unclassified Modicisalibacter]MBZ9560407.1 SpoIIE family protein phosphatase [Modicisalibacter sp. R2A 31.J]MBZ9576316.1 SpoIIE family protein phosphatase [Modicisalibacter sp. MOD 31.J]